MGLETMAAIGLGLAIVGTTVSVVGSLEQGAAQKKAERARQRLQQVSAQRERTQQIRQARIKRAQIAQSGTNSGAGESSAVEGGMAGVQSQALQNIGFIGRQVNAGEEISRANQDLINAQGISSLGGGITDIGGTIFSNRAELNDIGKTIFG